MLKPHYDRCGRKRAITGKTEKALEKSLRECPDATLQERKDALGPDMFRQDGLGVIKTAEGTLQKKSQRAAEQDREDVALKRADWFECQPGVDPE